jgi:CBS domain-containing protein
MFVADLLNTKGSFVATIRPEGTVAELLDTLARYDIGALVVSADGKHIDGIVSERDVVRELQRIGPRLVDRSVFDIMTVGVRTCTRHDFVDDLMLTMTRDRIRHVPVLDDGTLAGIVSIGDVVKSRLDELQGERDDLIQYITH